MAAKKATGDAGSGGSAGGGASKQRIDRLAEAVRRLAKDQNVTEEQQREILWLAEGKDPEKEWEKFSKVSTPDAGQGEET